MVLKINLSQMLKILRFMIGWAEIAQLVLLDADLGSPIAIYIYAEMAILSRFFKLLLEAFTNQTEPQRS